jgi:hypothetical protein
VPTTLKFSVLEKILFVLSSYMSLPFIFPTTRTTSAPSRHVVITPKPHIVDLAVHIIDDGGNVVDVDQPYARSNTDM